jgi:hypothetical protein
LGLTVGAIGLVLNICVAGLVGFCGPVVALLAGGIAGYLTAQQEKLPARGDGARAGAISGAIAGALIVLGQIIGGVGALFYFQSSGINTPFGPAPNLSSDPSSLIGYYGGGLIASFCFGLVGTLLAAGTGAGAGYLGTTEQPAGFPQGPTA